MLRHGLAKLPRCSQLANDRINLKIGAQLCLMLTAFRQHPSESYFSFYRCFLKPPSIPVNLQHLFAIESLAVLDFFNLRHVFVRSLAKLW